MTGTSGGSSDSCEIEAARLLRALVRKGKTVACAESCTGGLIAQSITSIPGASAAFMGGAVVYANNAKGALLGVSERTMAEHGAVSAETALEMAKGVASRLGSDVAVAVSGIAGPDGGTQDKPVGTVWFGYVGREPNTERLLFSGDRRTIREAAAVHAMRALRESLENT